MGVPYTALGVLCAFTYPHVLCKDRSCMYKVYVAVHDQLREATKHLSPGQEGLRNLLLCFSTIIRLLREVLVRNKVEDKVPQADLKHFSGTDHQSCNMGWIMEERGRRDGDEKECKRKGEMGKDTMGVGKGV